MSLPSLKFLASPNYSARNAKTRLIVVHDCEGSFGGSVSWFAEARSQVSAHLVLSEDGTQAIQMVHWANKAWHACTFNSVSEGIESAGFSAKGLGAPEWESLASIVAFRLHANDLPPVWARRGNGAGFEQHVGLGAAGGGHHDITSASDVWMAFVAMVQSEYQKPQPASWLPSNDPVGPLPPPPANWKPIGTLRSDLVVGSLAWAQAQLNARHIAVPPLIVDGMDGPATRTAMMLFQQGVKLAPDGEIGPLTIAALHKVA
jgi:hypothetical protein